MKTFKWNSNSKKRLLINFWMKIDHMDRLKCNCIGGAFYDRYNLNVNFVRLCGSNVKNVWHSKCFRILNDRNGLKKRFREIFFLVLSLFWCISSSRMSRRWIYIQTMSPLEHNPFQKVTLRRCFIFLYLKRVFMFRVIGIRLIHDAFYDQKNDST